MTSKPAIYLDYNATAPIRPEAKDAVLRAFELAGNPSSVHAAGRAARDPLVRLAAHAAIEQTQRGVVAGIAQVLVHPGRRLAEMGRHAEHPRREPDEIGRAHV